MAYELLDLILYARVAVVSLYLYTTLKITRRFTSKENKIDVGRYGKFFFYCMLLQAIPFLTAFRVKLQNARPCAKNMKSRLEWIKEKKERRRRQGKEARLNTKYTGRRRAGHGF